MPKLLDIDKFCEDLPEVESKIIVQKRFFHPQGLFSEQLFGPLKNFTCQCNKYYGPFSTTKVCKVCNVEVVNSSERRRRYAKITLPIPVINPLFYDIIGSVNATIKKQVDALLYNRKSILYYDPVENMYCICDDDAIPENITETWETIDGVRELVTKFAEQFSQDGNEKDKPRAQFMLDNIDSMIIHNVIVLPPELRPASKNAKVPTVDQINKIYQNILTKKEVMHGTNINLDNKDIFYNYFIQIQKDVFELYQYILEKLSKKEGMIRGNILGKRVDFSGRAVISPDPNLDIEYCKLPYIMVLELFKLPIAKKLIELNRFKMINEAIDFVDECILFKRPILLRITEEITKNEVCLLNRQPSLHRLSMLGFKILITLDSVIKIHPLVCPPYNADFDGDQMAVFIPIGEKAKQEIHDKLIITKNFTSPTDGSLTTTPSQDIILGIYALTMNLFPNLQELVECKGKMISKSFKIFNDCLPDDYKLIDYPLKKKELIYVLDDINKTYSNAITAKTLDCIKGVGFVYSTLYGSSMSLNKCVVPNAKLVRDNIYKDGDIRTQLERISSKEVEDAVCENFQYSYSLKSGARGTWDQARQIILSRGFISNSQGHILPFPIKNSLIEGLTPKEFFYSTYGCRKGLLDVADNTAESGYLSRKLIFACANLLIDTKESDCGVTEDESLSIVVKDSKKAYQLIGKWWYDNGVETLITKENCKSLVGRIIKTRSPIFCKSDVICSKCYGEMYKHLDSKFAGVVAAQALGEVNTQLVLRSFHSSGVAVIKEKLEGSSKDESEDMKQQDVINSLSKASKLLHHFDNTSYTEIVANLFDIYNSSKNINHVNFEVIVTQMMWTNNVLKWRLQPNRKDLKIEYHSVNRIPSDESWLMGLGFSNPRKHIISGIFNTGNYMGIMDKILCGEKVA